MARVPTSNSPFSKVLKQVEGQEGSGSSSNIYYVVLLPRDRLRRTDTGGGTRNHRMWSDSGVVEMTVGEEMSDM